MLDRAFGIHSSLEAGRFLGLVEWCCIPRDFFRQIVTRGTKNINSPVYGRLGIQSDKLTDRIPNAPGGKRDLPAAELRILSSAGFSWIHLLWGTALTFNAPIFERP